MKRINPTEAVSVDFTEYVREKKERMKPHMQGGIPDYAYGSDCVLRQKLRAVPGFYPLAKMITNTYVPRMKQQINLDGLKVGPSQFPDVYEIAADCARRLGIGVPDIYIRNSPSEINAFAYATEDDAPLIEITSALLERVTPGELRAVIGHECGHIHNAHGIYNTAAQIVLNSMQVAIPGVQQLLAMVSAPLRWAFMAWQRAAEVTCDRAGVICSEDPQDGVMLQAKLMSGAAFNHSEINLEPIMKQYDTLRETPVRLLELEYTHPLSIRRIFAIKEFLGSELLYTWRPEWKTPGMRLIDKQELDARCEKYISVSKSEERRRHV